MRRIFLKLFLPLFMRIFTIFSHLARRAMSAFLCLIFLYPTNKSRNTGQRQRIKANDDKIDAEGAKVTRRPQSKGCFCMGHIMAHSNTMFFSAPLCAASARLCVNPLPLPFLFFRISISAPLGASHTFIASSTRVRRLREGRKVKAVFAWATSWPMARQCFSLRPFALPLRSSALILCLFSLSHFRATWRFTYIYCLIHATSPGYLRARGGGGDTAATPGIPVRGFSAAFKRVQSAPAAAHAESVLPPGQFDAISFRMAAPGGPGRRGFTKPPICVFFREGGGPHAGL